MHLVRPLETGGSDVDDPDTGPFSSFVGAQLMVLFADGDELRPVRTRGSGSIQLAAGYCISEDDTYLVLPDDIGEEIVNIFRAGDLSLLEEALDEGLLVHGHLQRGPGGKPSLLAAYGITLTDGLRRLPYAAEVEVPGESDPVKRLNTLAHAQCTMVSALLDHEGLEAVLRNPCHLGESWRPPQAAAGLQHLSPTYLLSRHDGDAHVGLELALFVEDDDLIALTRPARLLLRTD